MQESSSNESHPNLIHKSTNVLSVTDSESAVARHGGGP